MPGGACDLHTRPAPSIRRTVTEETGSVEPWEVLPQSGVGVVGFRGVMPVLISK